MTPPRDSIKGETTRVSDDVLDEIERVAKAATQYRWYTTGSPWFSSGDGVLAGSPDPHAGFMIADCEAFGMDRVKYDGPLKLADPDDDAAHIARMDPPTTLDLIADLRDARARIHDLTERLRVSNIEADHMRKTSIQNAQERNAARARIRALEAANAEMVEALKSFSAYPVETIRVTEDGRGFYVIVLRRPHGGQPTFADFDRARALTGASDTKRQAEVDTAIGGVRE